MARQKTRFLVLLALLMLVALQGFEILLQMFDLLCGTIRAVSEERWKRDTV